MCGRAASLPLNRRSQWLVGDFVGVGGCWCGSHERCWQRAQGFCRAGMLGGDQQQEYGGRAQQRLVDWDADRCQAQQGMAMASRRCRLPILRQSFLLLKLFEFGAKEPPGFRGRPRLSPGRCAGSGGGTLRKDLAGDRCVCWRGNGAQDLGRPFLYNMKANQILRTVPPRT